MPTTRQRSSRSKRNPRKRQVSDNLINKRAKTRAVAKQRPHNRLSDSEDDDDDEEGVYKPDDSASDSDSDLELNIQLRPKAKRNPPRLLQVSEDSDLMDRLAQQFNDDLEQVDADVDRHLQGDESLDNHPASNTLEQDGENGHSTNRVVLPTIKTYKQEADKWPPSRIAEVQRSKRTKGTAVPPAIYTEALAIQKLYKQHKSMLAMIGNISMYTLNKALGELGGRRAPDGYRLWLSYSNEIRNFEMPKKGHEGDLGSRNRILGGMWSALPDNHREVFQPAIFYTLSGLSHSIPGITGEEDDDEEEELEVVPQVELEPEERMELQRLYDLLVCKEKVAKEYAKVAAGIPHGPTLPDFNRQSLKCIVKLNNQIENESNRMDFAYYLLACSTQASSEANSGAPGWCRVYTSHKEMADYVRKQSNFPIVFATRTQGLAADEVVGQAIGRNLMLSIENARKPDAGDKVKKDLALFLRGELTALLGREQGFPRDKEPAKIFVERGYKIKMLQLPGSKLPAEVLKLGFDAMNSKRKLWLEDCNSRLFKLVPSDENNNNPTSIPPVPDMDDSDEQDLNDVVLTQDQQMQEIDEDDEWSGIS